MFRGVEAWRRVKGGLRAAEGALDTAGHGYIDCPTAGSGPGGVAYGLASPWQTRSPEFWAMGGRAGVGSPGVAACFANGSDAALELGLSFVCVARGHGRWKDVIILRGRASKASYNRLLPAYRLAKEPRWLGPIPKTTIHPKSDIR
ncbi:hypothetical protein BT67DRAFT_103816 [Trichocladium antarcticum]|uniref:Uncharacterized protein n=1 Tax=Trichocladium antarcticum TaxID=1450529 RepID=A0AAN6UQZ1_9PEZI|nr:hypothetical protein BT67DRAFT_103816 [Trichocladium antarcticum]